MNIALPQASQRAPMKPREFEPCNGCGWCCAAQPCGIAVEFLKAPANEPCPALEFEGGRFWCGMVRNPAKYLDMPAWAGEMKGLGALYGKLLGIGTHCDSSDFDAPVLDDGRLYASLSPRSPDAQEEK